MMNQNNLRQIDFCGPANRVFVRLVLVILVCWVGNCKTIHAQSLSLEHEGFTEPRFDILVAATEIGRIQAVHVEVGDVVQAGQLIANLEDSSQAAALESAKFRAAMHGELDAAKAEALMAEARLQKLQQLAIQDMARPDEVARATADFEVAKSRQLAQLEQSQLRELELKRYELQLQRRQIIAPMSGVVAKVFHGPGEYLTPGDPAVIRLIHVDQIDAVFNLPAADALKMRVGQPQRIRLVGLRKLVDSRVRYVAPAIDGESGTVEVRFAIENRNGSLRCGDRCLLPTLGTHASAQGQPHRARVVRTNNGGVTLR